MCAAAVADYDNNVNSIDDNDNSNTIHKNIDVHYSVVVEPFHIKCINNSEFNT